jgi:F-type H+-transporting ATPase subunit b
MWHKKSVSAGLAMAAMLAMPVMALAAEAVGAEEVTPGLTDMDVGTMIVTILVFVSLVLVLRFTAWKPIMAGLKGREMAIRDSIEAAERARADAERTTKELEAKMAEASRQGAAQLAQAKSDAVKVAESIRQQAESEAVALKERTLREIDGAKQQALTEINTHAAELGVTIARKILQRNVTVDDQQRLVDESLAALAAKN